MIQAVEEANEICEFMQSGDQLFDSTADTIQKIGEESLKAKKMVETLPQMLKVWHRLDEKNRLLRQMAGGANSAQPADVDVKAVANEWGNFTEKLHRYGEVAEDRKNQLQKGIVKQVLHLS